MESNEIKSHRVNRINTYNCFRQYNNSIIQLYDVNIHSGEVEEQYPDSLQF